MFLRPRTTSFKRPICQLSRHSSAILKVMDSHLFPLGRECVPTLATNSLVLSLSLRQYLLALSHKDFFSHLLDVWTGQVGKGHLVSWTLFPLCNGHTTMSPPPSLRSLATRCLPFSLNGLTPIGFLAAKRKCSASRPRLSALPVYFGGVVKEDSRRGDVPWMRGFPDGGARRVISPR